MEVKATVTEELLVTKEVSVTVPDDADEDMIDQAIRDKAYERTIPETFEDHGWECVDCLSVEVVREE